MSYRDPRFENPLLTGDRPEKQPLRMYGLSRVVPEDTYKRNKYAFDKWSADEQEVFFELLSHFKQDFLMIATHMNRTFPKNHFPQYFLRYIYQQLIQDTPITKNEVLLILNVLLEHIDKYEQKIWNKVMMQFKGMHSIILRKKFYNYLQDVMRSMNIYYTDYQNQHFYDGRLVRFKQTFINLIFFLNKLELQKFEKEDLIFSAICQSCKQFVKLLVVWVNKDMMDINVPRDVFFTKKFGLEVPQMSPNEFVEMMEPLLTLELTFDFKPYDKNNLDQVLYNPVVELEYSELSARRQLKIGYSFLEKNWHKTPNKLEIKYYPQFSSDQIRFLLSSSTVDLLLSYLSYFHADNKKNFGYNNQNR